MTGGNDSRKGTMTTDHDIACDRIRDAIALKFLAMIEVTRVDTLPNPVYAFDPEGWEIYYVSGRYKWIVTEDGDYWGYHPPSGEVRHLIARRCWWGASSL